VYVGNVSWSSTSDRIKEHMSAAGEVVSVEIPTRKNGRSLGFAIVEYVTGDEADLAISTLNDTEVDERKLNVRRNDPEQAYALKGKRKRETEPIEETPEEKPCRVYVHNLPWATDSTALQSYMSAAGSVTLAEVIMKGKRSSGVGFVDYETEEMAQHAVASLNETELEDRLIVVQSKQMDRPQKSLRSTTVLSKEEKAQRRVYVSNLRWETTLTQLLEHMEQIGPVVGAKLETNTEGVSLGRGAVVYAIEASAEEAISKLNKVELAGRAVTLSATAPKVSPEAQKAGRSAKDLEELKSTAAKALAELTAASSGEMKSKAFMHLERILTLKSQGNDVVFGKQWVRALATNVGKLTDAQLKTIKTKCEEETTTNWAPVLSAITQGQSARVNAKQSTQLGNSIPRRQWPQTTMATSPPMQFSPLQQQQFQSQMLQQQQQQMLQMMSGSMPNTLHAQSPMQSSMSMQSPMQSSMPGGGSSYLPQVSGMGQSPMSGMGQSPMSGMGQPRFEY